MKRFFTLLAAFSMIVPVFLTGNEILFKALQDELSRSMEKLQIEHMPKPFFLEYNVMEVESLDIKASFGALTRSDRDHYRYLKTDLRIGSYQLDSSQFVGKDMMFSDFGRKPVNITLENDYATIRHTIWLATDNVYKNALERMAQKKAFINSQNKKPKVDDFSREKAYQSVSSPVHPTLSKDRWEETIRKMSAVFKKYPDIIDSKVRFGERLIHNYFVNSEGSKIANSTVVVAVVVNAVAQTKDGMKLKHSLPFYGSDLKHLPATKVMLNACHQMAGELSRLANAPLVEEDYTGPVLFTKQAAGELFLQIMASHFSGERPPLSAIAQMSQMIFSSKLTRRLNRRVLPKFLSIIDDPIRQQFQSKHLLGHFFYDEQGIPATAVKLVTNGFFRNQLMSRRPSEIFSHSTGHCRANTFGARAVVISNLFVRSSQGKSGSELKQELLRVCREEEIPYGLMVKAVDVPNISGINMNDDAYYHGVRISSGGILGKPVLLYRVYVKDGREELIRGLNFDEFSVRYMKDIMAAGKDYYIHNRLILPGSGMMDNLGFAMSSQRSAATGIKCSIIVPDILIKEMDFKLLNESGKKTPYLKHPHFRTE